MKVTHGGQLFFLPINDLKMTERDVGQHLGPLSSFVVVLLRVETTLKSEPSLQRRPRMAQNGIHGIDVFVNQLNSQWQNKMCKQDTVRHFLFYFIILSTVSYSVQIQHKNETPI